MAKVIFVKYLKFNNSECVRKLPYDGESWWAIRSIHHRRLLKLIDSRHEDKDFGNRKNWLIVRGEDMEYNDIRSIDYRVANDYVMGNSDRVPELLPFNPSLHCCDWSPNKLYHLGFSKYEIESYGLPYWFMDTKYHVLINR